MTGFLDATETRPKYLALGVEPSGPRSLPIQAHPESDARHWPLRIGDLAALDNRQSAVSCALRLITSPRRDSPPYPPQSAALPTLAT